jgi:hypothetical protein
MIAKDIALLAEWLDIKNASASIRVHQEPNGSISEISAHKSCKTATSTISKSLRSLARIITHDKEYLLACADDFDKWADGGFQVPDFYNSLEMFHPENHRVDALPHVVVFPMYTQNGSTERLVEAVLFEVIWPDFIAKLEDEAYSNAAFVPIRFVDFTDGYQTNSAVLFPESVSVLKRNEELPKFTWGGIFADREAARFRKVVREVSKITNMDVPSELNDLLTSQETTETTYVMWDLIHDRAHMRGDLPFDPFMIKQRMPFFLYGIEELRCDLTAFRECVKLSKDKNETAEVQKHAKLVQYAILFDRIFRFALSGTRTRNYDAVAGQLLFAYLHQRRVINWTDTSLSINWDELPDVVVQLSDDINELYWKSIDRPKVVHWLATYDLISSTLAPHPASKWAIKDLPLLNATNKELTDAVLDDEFPLSMFYEALIKKSSPVIESTIGITGTSEV